MRRFTGLRRQAAFARLRRFGRRTSGPNLVLYRSPQATGLQRPQVGIAVSKAVGGAVVRNTVRRRIQACLHELLVEPPCDRMLVIAHPGAALAPYAALRAELRAALHT